MRNINKGFTLVELSISLMIIGLLIAGVSSGMSVMRTAQLNTIITEKTKFSSAVEGFRKVYNALPGDMDAATTPFPTSNNGNGDGRLVWFNSVQREGLLAWQQLALAKLITGVYSGTGSAAAITISGSDPTVNSPSSSYSGGIWSFTHTSQGETESSIVLPTGLIASGNFLLLGSYSSSNIAMGPVLSPINAMSLDMKYDDGLPLAGDIFAMNASNNAYSSFYTCISGTDPATATYDVQTSNTRNGLGCALGFLYQ